MHVCNACLGTATAHGLHRRCACCPRTGRPCSSRRHTSCPGTPASTSCQMCQHSLLPTLLGRQHSSPTILLTDHHCLAPTVFMTNIAFKPNLSWVSVGIDTACVNSRVYKRGAGMNPVRQCRCLWFGVDRSGPVKPGP